MRTAGWISIVGALAAVAACGDDDGGGTTMMTPDTGTPPIDLGPPEDPDLGTDEPDAGPIDGEDAGTPPEPDASGISCETPPPPYGTRLSARMEPFTLPDCDGVLHSFYDEQFCSTTLTVVSIAAGWCPPCIRESRQLTERITEVYRDRGVRVIQVLVQTEDYRAPSPEFCHQWVDDFGLTNIELRDEFGMMQIYFPDGVLPDTMIVDHDGIIQFREHGATDGLTSLQAALDRLLEGR